MCRFETCATHAAHAFLKRNETKNAETEFGSARYLHNMHHIELVYRHVFSHLIERETWFALKLRYVRVFVCVLLDLMRMACFFGKSERTEKNHRNRRQFCGGFILNKKKPISYWNLSIRLNHTDQHNRFFTTFFLFCCRCCCLKRGKKTNHNRIHGQFLFLLQCNPLNIANVLLIGFASVKTSRILILNHNFIGYLFGSICEVGAACRFLFVLLWNVWMTVSKQELLLVEGKSQNLSH